MLMKAKWDSIQKAVKAPWHRTKKSKDRMTNVMKVLEAHSSRVVFEYIRELCIPGFQLSNFSSELYHRMLTRSQIWRMISYLKMNMSLTMITALTMIWMNTQIPRDLQADLHHPNF